MTNTNTGFSMVNHVGITVSNLERSIQFYEALTGKKSPIKIRLAANAWRKRKD